MTRFWAHFTPEAWVRDQAIEVDSEGPQTWDCTRFATENIAYLVSLPAGDDLADAFGVIDNDDVFKADPDAPEWVREWRGPFTIRIQEVPS